ncbi:hypothetical protein Tco_1429880 [Tanacetum coccineum]
MGELTFFLGLQVKQKKDGIFISQDKYVAEILKKFGFTEVKTARTPMETQKPLLKDEDGDEVHVHMYRSMIGSLMYLTSSRLDIMFAMCACARYQVNPKVSHLYAVKRSFSYLKGQPKLGLWYPKDYRFNLVAYTNSDYARASLNRKSTIGGCQFLRCRLISWQCKKQTVVANSTTEAEYVAASSCCGQVLWIQNQLLDYGYNFMHTKIFIDNNSTICIIKNPVFHSKTKHIEIRHHFIRDCNEKKLIQMVKIHTDKNVADLLTKAFDLYLILLGKAKKSVRLMMGKLFGMELKLILVTQSEGSAIPTDPHHTPTFIQPFTQPQKIQQPRKPKRKDTQVPQPSDPIENVADEAVHKELGDSLVRAATTTFSLEVKQDSVNITRSDEDRRKLDELMALRTTLQNKRLYKVGLTASIESSDNEESLGEDASKQERIDAIDADVEITVVSVHDVNVSAGEEVFIATVDDITLAQALEEMKSTKPKKKGVVIQELGECTTTISLQLSSQQSHYKGKGILIEPANIDVDHQLAERMQAQEQEEFSIKENATLFQQLLEKRRKHFAAKRAEEKRNKPPTKAQQRKIMCTYLKNMEGYKLKDLKLKEFDSIQEMFNKAFKKVNTFEDFRIELVEGKEKRAGTEL